MSSQSHFSRRHSLTWWSMGWVSVYPMIRLEMLNSCSVSSSVCLTLTEWVHVSFTPFAPVLLWSSRNHPSIYLSRPLSLTPFIIGTIKICQTWKVLSLSMNVLLKLLFLPSHSLFSLNSCEQATVEYIMDHLKVVASHSDKNKMTPQALAMIFGPLFTCHSESEYIHKSVEVFKFLLEIWPNKKGKCLNIVAS